MATRHLVARRAPILTALALAGALLVAPAGVAETQPPEPAAPNVAVDVPEVLQGDTWLRHHREDLMPYWDMPEALGVPVGNFPSFRGPSGELIPASTNRGLSTLARQVYGYSLAFMLTGEERYLTYAKAGIDWINTKAEDTVHGGYFGDLTADGSPANNLANKDVDDLASLGLAYGMYFNVTRDPAAEADLLAVRDLLFAKYYNPTTNRVRDSLTYDLATTVDTGNNGFDITNVLVPGTALSLTNAPLLTNPSRRTQFREDLRTLTGILVARHKNSASTTEPWWFWGRTQRVGNLGALQTDFGHNIKSYELIHNADQVFADRPWAGLAPDRDELMSRAWDAEAARWNERLINFTPGDVERDSGWWVHAEADQTLAALDLGNDFAHRDQLARSAQSWLDVFVDSSSPSRETFARVTRDGSRDDLRKSFRGKNMLHAHEHALIMYLHGRALEQRPARLYYALPDDQALTAVAKPYWFDASGEARQVIGDLGSLPGHVLVDVRFSGIGAVPAPPYPVPDDRVPPTTAATTVPDASVGGWHDGEVTVSLSASDDLVGVKEIHARVERNAGSWGSAHIGPGDELVLPPLTTEGEYEITYFAVDRNGNREEPRALVVRIDRTSPTLSGLPEEPCVIWPPDGRMVRVANVVGVDALSGLADLRVTAASDEAGPVDDIRIVDGSVELRAARDGEGSGRTYTVGGTAIDRAGNLTTGHVTCSVPHDQRR